MTPYIMPGTLPISEHKIIDIACELSGVSKEDLTGNSRKRIYVIPRHVAMYFIHKTHPKYSLEQIGWMFNRGHATVISALKGVETIKDRDLNDLTKKVGERIKSNNLVSLKQ